MGERWNWDCGVEGEVADGAEQITLAEHKQLWKRFLRYWKSENYRMRECYGCVYLRTTGNCLCCTHLLATGKRRPPKNADGSCGGRVEFPGFAPDEAYQRFLKAAAEYDKGIENSGIAPGRAYKRAVRWDTNYAFGLYQRKFSLTEIARIMDVKHQCIVDYARRHKWRNPLHRVRACHTDAEIQNEIEAYKAYQAKGRTATTE